MNDIQFTLNGKAVSYAGSAANRLLDVLRDIFRCTSVKCGCKEGECGACSVLLDGKLAIAADAMSVVAGITLVVAAVQFISPRVNTIASIMTFTNNAQTMADLSSAIYGTAALLIAVVLNIIAAFTNVNEQ